MLKNNQLLADTMRKAAAIRRKASGGRRSDDASSSDNTSSCSSSSKNHTSSSKVSSTAPPLPPPPPTHITNSQGRKATPDEMALTAKNYRLAKELVRTVFTCLLIILCRQLFCKVLGVRLFCQVLPYNRLESFERQLVVLAV